jgi:hypothetical protein
MCIAESSFFNISIIPNLTTKYYKYINLPLPSAAVTLPVLLLSGG